MATPRPGFKVYKSFERADPAMIEKFRGLASANISDIQGRQNTFDARIKPIYAPMAPLCGPAFTVKARPGDNLLATKAIHMAQPGDVIVISGGFEMNLSVWGGVMSGIAKAKGIAGVLTDALVRDVAEIRDIGLIVYATGLTPVGPTKEGVGQINTPIVCGGVIVNPGDIIVGDEDGAVVVRKEEAEAVLARTHARMELEKNWFEAIAHGEIILEDTDDYLRERGAEIID
ncbi:MAG: RraA family protein [Chloroflexota bacterium]|nr:RraA family protein [Chloroflexota bacterium]